MAICSHPQIRQHNSLPILQHSAPLAPAMARTLALTIALTALPCAVLAALPSTSPVVQWVNLLQTDLRSIPNLQSQVGSKFYALHAQAVWEALKANRGGKASGVPKYNETAVVAYTSHTLLTHYFHWWFFRHDSLIKSQLAGWTEDQLKGPRKLGETIANRVIASRVGDGFARWANFIPAPQNTTASIGKYQFTPNQTFALYPQYGKSKPILLSRNDVNTIVNKYKNKFKGYFQSEQYYADLNQTYTLGWLNSTSRTPYDAITPRFWAGPAGTSLIAGQFINISISVLPSNYSLWDQARYFYLLGATVSDASTACYNTKYEVLFWRPVTAIQFGDGTNRYKPDPKWVPFLNTPNHPSYPSGHQCVSGSAAAVLKHTLGTSQVNITIGSEDVPGQLRNFTSLEEVTRETSLSRVLGGIHFQQENVDGLDLGADTLDLVLKKFH